jgi:hypothetical protein
MGRILHRRKAVGKEQLQVNRRVAGKFLESGPVLWPERQE